MPDTVAVDIALLPPRHLHRQLVALNARLEPPPVGFRFDDTHHPHLTLAQLFTHDTNIASLALALGDTLSGHAPLALATAGVTAGPHSSSLLVEPSESLATLHRQVMDAMLPFDRGDGGAEAFARDDEAPRVADVEWVKRFRTHSAYGRFEPHWTLGIGTLDGTVDRVRFDAAAVSLFRLGRFCTCGHALGRWTLTAQDR